MPTSEPELQPAPDPDTLEPDEPTRDEDEDKNPDLAPDD